MTKPAAFYSAARAIGLIEVDKLTDAALGDAPERHPAYAEAPHSGPRRVPRWAIKRRPALQQNTISLIGTGSFLFPAGAPSSSGSSPRFIPFSPHTSGGGIGQNAVGCALVGPRPFATLPAD
jgi:hypothetical protein